MATPLKIGICLSLGATRPFQSKKDNFKHVVRMFPTKDYAANHNCQRLRRLGLPVARIPSKNNYATAKEANSDEAKRLQDVFCCQRNQGLCCVRVIHSDWFGEWFNRNC